MVELWEERNLPFRVLFAPVQHVRSAQAVDPDTSPHVRRAPLVRAVRRGPGFVVACPAFAQFDHCIDAVNVDFCCSVCDMARLLAA